MSDNGEILTELKKMNEFLEKIDWKLWTLHEKVFGSNVPATNSTDPTKETVVKDVEPVVPIAKYPTIETWE